MNSSTSTAPPFAGRLSGMTAMATSVKPPPVTPLTGTRRTEWPLPLSENVRGASTGESRCSRLAVARLPIVRASMNASGARSTAGCGGTLRPVVRGVRALALHHLRY